MTKEKKHNLSIQEIVFVGSTLIALLGQWFILDERVDILERKVEYHKTEILQNSEYRETNAITDAEQEVRIEHLEEK